MKHKVAELEGERLDAAVANLEGLIPAMKSPYLTPGGTFRPSTDWRDGGPIIDREQIMFSERTQESGGGILAIVSRGGIAAAGPTHLIAAMRAFCASRFGEEVKLP